MTKLICSLLLMCSIPSSLSAQPGGIDPLEAAIDTRDADRFAALFDATNGRPSAAQIQSRYLDGAGEGVRIFTPDRIRDAAALAAYVAANSEDYRRAIDHCLPIVKQASSEVRAIYLALRGLYPDRALPPIHVVFGRGNSGGTATAEGQVLGLEVLCKIAPTPAQLRQEIRIMAGHETVHTWQPENTGKETNVLLRAVLQEGAADYVASLVFGGPPSIEREQWATAREGDLWRQFEADVALTRTMSFETLQTDPGAKAAMQRWVGNYGSAPDGWPYEMGYWIGMRIWQRYVERAPDMRVAIDDVLRWSDPEVVLARGKP